MRFERGEEKRYNIGRKTEKTTGETAI